MSLNQDVDRHVENIINYYQRNIRDYTDNIHEYNTIIRTYLNNRYNRTNVSLNDGHTNVSLNGGHTNPFLGPFTRVNGGNTNPYLRTFHNFPQQSRMYGQIDSDYEDVVVHPTSAQIENALENYVFSSTGEVTICPITLDPIQAGEEVSRIRYCGHTFKKNAIHRWFIYNVRCPVCRYDIRNYMINEDETKEEETKQEETKQEETFTNQNTNVQNMFEQYSTNFTNIIRNILNDEFRRRPMNMGAGDLVYTFELPLNIDMSGNDYTF